QHGAAADAEDSGKEAGEPADENQQQRKFDKLGGAKSCDTHLAVFLGANAAIANVHESCFRYTSHRARSDRCQRLQMQGTCVGMNSRSPEAVFLIALPVSTP